MDAELLFCKFRNVTCGIANDGDADTFTNMVISAAKDFAIAQRIAESKQVCDTMRISSSHCEEILKVTFLSLQNDAGHLDIDISFALSRARASRSVIWDVFASCNMQLSSLCEQKNGVFLQ